MPSPFLVPISTTVRLRNRLASLVCTDCGLRMGTMSTGAGTRTSQSTRANAGPSGSRNICDPARGWTAGLSRVGVFHGTGRLIRRTAGIARSACKPSHATTQPLSAGTVGRELKKRSLFLLVATSQNHCAPSCRRVLAPLARAQAFCAACPRTPAAAYCPPANLQVKGQHSEARAAKSVSAA